jgi:2'-5' RNA ligase
MSCDKTSTHQGRWAGGRALVWFCDQHWSEFEKEHAGDISSMKKLAGSYYDWKPGMSLEDVIQAWQKNGAKVYEDSGAHYSPKELVPYREYAWTREKARNSPEEWDALVEKMKSGWDPKKPLSFEIGRAGGAKVGEGNHRLAIALKLGLTKIPVEFYFKTGRIASTDRIVERYLKKADAATGKKDGDGSDVGFFIPLPEVLAKQFPSLGSKDKSPPHTTFLFVGEVPKEKETLFLDVSSRVLSEMRHAVTGVLYGPDYFMNPGKNQKVALMRVRFDQALAELRWKLRDALMDAGFQIQDSFPLVYQPHVTLAYMEGLDTKYTGNVPVGQWSFNNIEVWGLSQVHSIVFGSQANKIASRYMK